MLSIGKKINSDLICIPKNEIYTFYVLFFIFLFSFLHIKTQSSHFCFKSHKIYLALLLYNCYSCRRYTMFCRMKYKNQKITFGENILLGKSWSYKIGNIIKLKIYIKNVKPSNVKTYEDY